MKSNKGYYTVLFLAMCEFVTLIWLMASSPEITYFASGIMSVMFLALAIMMLFLVSKDPYHGWPFAIFFFIMNIMNSVYIFFFSISFALFLYSLSSVAGLILSVYNIDSGVRSRFKRMKEKTREKTAKVKAAVKRSIKRKRAISS